MPEFDEQWIVLLRFYSENVVISVVREIKKKIGDEMEIIYINTFMSYSNCHFDEM